MKFFTGRKLVLSTMHEKEKVMKEILEKELSVEVIIPKDFDTDKFGTFTGEKKRTGNQLEAARKKAIAGMEKLELDLSVSSEGSFGTDPNLSWVGRNLELVLLIDKKNNLEIKGHHSSLKTMASGTYVSNFQELLEKAKSFGFPEHGIVLKNKEDGKKIYKSIQNLEELKEKADKLFKGFFVKKIFIENDLRAHMNPTRMNNIKLATEDLIKNINSTCPKCDCPGFCIKDVEKGLPCAGCGIMNDFVSKNIYKCQKCNFVEKKQREDGLTYIEPENCFNCNP